MKVDTCSTSISEECHMHCFACAQDHPFGLRLQFEQEPDETNRLFGTFKISSFFQGYNGLVHGGIVATLLDSAMTSLLLKKGIRALTAELNTRYKRTLLPEREISVEAILVEARPPIYRLEARVMQNGVVSAIAKARFMKPAHAHETMKVN